MRPTVPEESLKTRWPGGFVHAMWMLFGRVLMRTCGIFPVVLSNALLLFVGEIAEEKNRKNISASKITLLIIRPADFLFELLL